MNTAARSNPILRVSRPHCITLQQPHKTILLATEEIWTKKKLLEAGFPHRPIPDKHEPSVSVSASGLEQLFKERQALCPMAPWELETYDTLKDWVLHGVPADFGPLKPHIGKHRLNGEEIKLTYDKLARFIESKLTNPNPWGFH